MKKLVIGNWKMNLLRADSVQLARNLAEKGESVSDMVVCPPAVWLTDVAGILKGSAIALGAQDVHEAEKGAFTGNMSAAMLRDAGASYVLVGHSERRKNHSESSATICEKALAAMRTELVPVICFGETEEERQSGRHEEVVAQQLSESVPLETDAGSSRYVLAYEPVWAIGTGKTATVADITAMHGFVRSWLKRNRVDHAQQVCILYGGSVKSGNAQDILAILNVDGVLVGGASLDADEFWAIAQAG